MDQVRSAAMKALVSLAGPSDQSDLIQLLSETEDPGYIKDIQEAVATAAGKIPDPEMRSSVILNALSGTTEKIRIIPILAETGGQKALSVVLREFEEGNPEIRDVCFSTLTRWKDHTASSALFEICASGNKTFESRAFEGYINQISTSDLPDEEKLLLYRKILPYALGSERKNELIN